MALVARFRVKLPNIPLLHTGQGRALLSQEVAKGVTVVVERLANEARQRTPVGATGILRGSISARVTQGVDARVLVQGEVMTGRQAPYALYVEEGRPPGTMPPWGEGSSLRLWVQRVVGDVSRTFVIARAIGRRGTRGQWMFRDALAAVRPSIEPTIRAAVASAARLLSGGR